MMHRGRALRAHIRGQAISLGLILGIVVFVPGLFFTVGIHTIEIIALLLGVGVAAATLHRMPGPMSFGTGISHALEAAEREAYAYVNGFGRRGFGTIILVEVLTFVFLLYASLRWST